MNRLTHLERQDGRARRVPERAGHYAKKDMMARYDAANPRALTNLLASGTDLHAGSDGPEADSYIQLCDSFDYFIYAGQKRRGDIDAESPRCL